MSGPGSSSPPTSPTVPQARPLKGWQRPFASLAIPDYRLLWLGQMCTSFGQWMDQVSRGWLVYQLTGSPFLLGAVTATRAVPLVLFGILAGVAADRLGRKGQLIIAQMGNALINLLLAVLITTHNVQIWHIFATAFVAGTLQAFQQPARQALISDLVGDEHIVNAIALNSAVLNLSRSVGPSIAGFLIAAFGNDGSYYAQSVIYALSTVWTGQMRVPPHRRSLAEQEMSMWASLREGFSYIGNNAVIKMILVLALVPLFLGNPYTSLLPVFAESVLNVGSQGLGLLLAAPGIGALVGALCVAAMGGGTHKGKLLLGGAGLFGLSLVGVALSSFMLATLPLLALAGFANTSYNALANSLLQTSTPAALRGRVVSIYLLNRGLVPLGTLLAGTLATLLNARVAVGAMGAACALLVLWVAIASPEIKHIE